CTRLLNWLTPVEMRAAVEELRRVAKEVVLSIRLGDSRRATSTMTHSWEDFLPSLNGWWMHKVELLLNEGRNGNYYMIAMRRPTWQDVEDQFRWNQNGIQVLA